MTQPQDSAVAAVVDVLDAIDEPEDRFQGLLVMEGKLDVALRGVRRRIAEQLRTQGKTYREIGAIMGGVSAQRAEQIAKGR